MELKNKDRWYKTKFYVIDVPGYDAPSVIGLNSCKKLELVTIHSCDSIEPQYATDDSLKKQFPQQFDAIGKLEGKVKFQPKDEAETYIAAPRKCKEDREQLGKGQQQMIVYDERSSKKTLLAPLLTGQPVRDSKMVSWRDHQHSHATIVPRRSQRRTNPERSQYQQRMFKFKINS